jgi:hypothetical protein
MQWRDLGPDLQGRGKYEASEGLLSMVRSKRCHTRYVLIVLNDLWFWSWSCQIICARVYE